MLRRFLIRAALDLQFPPFLWVFRAYYGLAVRLTVRAVRGVPGVRAIYLSGSMARSTLIYGLSDIDFKIFVDRSTARDPIRERFTRLRRWFPMLGPPDEKGIYVLSDFAADYRHYPLVQHLFDERFYRHRLLWGDDVLPQLPVAHWSTLDQGLMFFWKLKDWTERVNLLAGSARLCRIQKHYLFYKACCDVGLMWLLLEHPARPSVSRDTVLETLAGSLDAAAAGWARLLLQERRRRWRRYVTHPESSYLAFKQLVDTVVARLSSAGAADDPLIFDVVPPAGPVAAVPAHVAAIQAAAPEVTISVRPWAFLPRSPFDLAFLGRPVYVLSASQPLRLAQVCALRACYRAHLASEAVLVVSDTPGWHYSVDSILVDHWLGTAGSDDLLGVFLRQDASVPLSFRQRSRISERLAAFRAQLEAALRSPDLARMEGPDFLRLLSNAVRTTIFAMEFTHRRLWLPHTPDDAIEYLRAETPLGPSFLDLLSRAHHDVADGRPFNERLRAKAVLLLNACVRVLAGTHGWDVLGALNDAPDEIRLRVSVVVVTRNRPVQLARCLPSLLRQRRVPDELVVVDSSSSGETSALVSRCDAPCPVRLVRSEHQGVAAARNEGLAAADGEIVAFADDDVVAEPDWLEALEFCFLRDPRVGIAGGSVLHLEDGRTDVVARFMRAVEKL